MKIVNWYLFSTLHSLSKHEFDLPKIPKGNIVASSKVVCMEILNQTLWEQMGISNDYLAIASLMN